MRPQKSAWLYWDERLIQSDYSKLSDSAVDVLLSLKSGGTIRLYLFLVRCLNGQTVRKKPPGWRMGENYICEKTKMSRAALYRGIKELESNGLLFREKTQTGQRVFLVSPPEETENRSSVQNRGIKKETPTKSNIGGLESDSEGSQGSHECDNEPHPSTSDTSYTNESLTNDYPEDKGIQGIYGVVPFWLSPIRDGEFFEESVAWQEWREPLKASMGSMYNIWVGQLKGLIHHQLDDSMEAGHPKAIKAGWRSITPPSQACTPEQLTIELGGTALVLYAENSLFLDYVVTHYFDAIREAVPAEVGLFFAL